MLEFRPPFSIGMDASLVIGQPSFTEKTPATTQSGLRGGTDFEGTVELGFDSSGNLWVGDRGNNRVLEFMPPFSTGMSASVVVGQENFTTGISRFSRDGLNAPGEVAFDRVGNLWVLDQNNNRVLEFEPPFTNGMNASMVIGQVDFKTFAYSTTQSGLGSGSFGDLAIDHSGNLWVGDTGNSRVLEFIPPFSDGMDASLVIGQTSFVTRISSLTESGLGGGLLALGVAFDPAGNLWVGDCKFNRILEFQPPFSTGMSASVVIGQQSFRTSTASTTQNGLVCPYHLGFDKSGNLWVPDVANNRVLEFSSSGSSVTSTPASSTTQTQSSQASATATTNDQGFGQLQYAAVGAVAVVVVVGLVAVFLRRRMKHE